MKEREALKLALEALKHTHPSPLTSFYTIGDRDKAIKAIEEHLAQPEPELTNLERHERNVQQLFGTPQPKEPEQCRKEQRGNGEYVCDCKSGECPVLAQPEQEPVAWLDPNQTVDTHALSWYQNKIHSVPLYISQQHQENPVAEISQVNGCPIVLWDKSLPIGAKLYTTPPQRTWVGLTDEDIKKHYQNQEWLDGVRFAEAKLKEKNT